MNQDDIPSLGKKKKIEKQFLKEAIITIICQLLIEIGLVLLNFLVDASNTSSHHSRSRPTNTIRGHDKSEKSGSINETKKSQGTTVVSGASFEENTLEVGVYDGPNESAQAISSAGLYVA
eukprot:Awhi_evm1s12402